jgi:hypothetical protein
MKTDDTGGPSAEDNVEERLPRRFAVELERAERDYPALVGSRLDPVPGGAAPGSARSLRAWRRLAVPMTVVFVLVAVSLVGVGIALRPSAGPTGLNNPAPANVQKGADGIPTAIDGQRVYRIGDEAEWQNLSGSFLLSGYAMQLLTGCKGQFGSPPPEDAFISWCMPMVLTPGPVTDFNGFDPSTFPSVAPRSLEALKGWFGGPAIVMRVHAHDPGAANCAAYLQPRCESAVVVEAVVWPTVPTQINGERVYRATDQASFPASGNFLLGGPATKPSGVPGCPPPIDKTAAEQQLIPYCYVLNIDGLSIAPMSNLDEPNGKIVVARVHINDPLAAQCPAVSSAVCETAIVVESVVWRSAESVTATPTSAASTTTPSNPASGEGVGPGPSASVGAAGTGHSVGPLDSDGVPTTIDGTPLYRATTVPATATTFLLGGILTHDTGCAPAVSLAPPACGYWMVDGVAVGAAQTVPESLTGSLVVARVDRMSDCQHAPCPTPIELLTTGEIVWSGPAVVAPPPPMLPGPSAS